MFKLAISKTYSRQQNDGGSLIVIGLLILLFFYDIILGFSHFPYDYEYYHYPLIHFNLESFRNLSFPIFQPHVYGGTPYLNNPQSAILYPPLILVGVLELIFGKFFDLKFFQLLNIFHFLIAGAGMYSLVRYFNPCRVLATALSIVFVSQGAFLGNSQHFGVIAIYGWIPWLFLFTERKLVNGSPITDASISMSWILIITSGFMPLVAVTVAVWELYIVTSLLLRIFGKTQIKRMSHKLVCFNLLLLISCLITAPVWLGYFEFSRLGSAVQTHGTVSSQALLTTILPDIFHSLGATNYKGIGDRTANYFFIGPILLIAIWKMFWPIGMKKIPATLVFIFCFLIGFFDPLSYLFQQTQVIGILLRPDLFPFFCFFLLLFNAGQWIEGTGQDLGPVLIMSSVIWATLFLILESGESAFQNYDLYLVTIILGGTLFVIAIGLRKKFIKNSLVVFICAGTLYGFHFTVNQRIWSFSGQPKTYGADFVGNNSEIIALLRGHGDLHRVAVNQKLLGGPWNGCWPVWRIDSINGFEPTLDHEYAATLRQGVFKWSTNRTFGELNPESFLLKRLNVKYYLTSDQDNFCHSRWQLIYEKFYKVFEYKDFSSRFFVLDGSAVIASEAERLVAFSSENEALTGEVLVKALQPGKYELIVRSYGPNDWLFMSQRFLPGWKIYFDGQEIQSYLTSDKLIQAIPLSDGVHSVILKFEPWSFNISFVVSFIGFVIFMITMMVGIKMKKLYPQSLNH